MPQYFRTDQARIQVSIAGVSLDNVSWDKMEGGDNVAPSTNYPPGGMQPSVELGGVPKRNPVTVERIWSDTLIAAYKAMDNGAGKLPVTASYTVLDRNGNPVPGSTISYTGVLLETARPNYDSSSSSEAMLKITVGLNGPIT
jgi:hypothetical protein